MALNIDLGDTGRFLPAAYNRNMTKKLKLALAMLSICAVAAGPVVIPAWSQAAKFREVGLGIIAGSPFGVTAKYFHNENWAFDAGAGYGNAGVFYGDVLYNWWGLAKPAEGKLDVYGGVGPRVATDDGGQFSVRTIAGVGYWPKAHPVEYFAEFGPAWKISPSDRRVGLDGGVGFRYYFNLAVSRAKPGTP